MIAPRLILCGGASIPPDSPLRKGREIVSLDTRGDDANVHVRIEDVARRLALDLTPRLTDLLEIAAYVYSADAATSRGKGWGDNCSTEPWARSFHFVIAVRDLEFWSDTETRRALKSSLSFLSDDTFTFDFVHQDQWPPAEQYLVFDDNGTWPAGRIDRVVMFSGGLDSLSGVVDCLRRGERLALVSHRPVPAMSKRQRQLVDALRKMFDPAALLHVPVWINKDKWLGREHTQRTRSFLFTALGAVVAASVNCKGVTFFENGVVSINLPVADEVIRARASRTTHPAALRHMETLCSLVLGQQMTIENPFIFDTKADVVRRLAGPAASLIGLTCSCAHTGFFQSKTQRHCGTCSQCIDRRVAILAEGLGDHDEETDYKVDVLTGPREEGYERNMAVHYTRHATELHRMNESEMAMRFATEFTRAARPFPSPRETTQKLIDMHKRHAAVVFQVIHGGLAAVLPEVIDGTLEESSLLSMVVGGRHRGSIWRQFVDRISETLDSALPTACKSHKPIDEPHLQEIADGILKAADIKLQREFPFLAWGSSKTKPDWSAEHCGLWVEAKYIRAKQGVRVAESGIAEDVTKYGDLGRKVLFVVYDPEHQIPDDGEFAAPVSAHDGMFVHVIR